MAQTPTGGSSGEYWTMGESLIQQCRVSDEGLRVVKLFYPGRSEEHTSELQSLMRISYAVFCLIKNTVDSAGGVQEMVPVVATKFSPVGSDAIGRSQV